eukprot:TRINITY_DN11584_c0_g12_i1.p1 TRINITY_DN11584_c0_g12~~TRINITY_DN11584_c0_g12_i1.p1  ORF type:complete len:550 (+),score=133.01 TRINITY_DN11584_c0_g12_i1:323-1972(+)
MAQLGDDHQRAVSYVAMATTGHVMAAAVDPEDDHPTLKQALAGPEAAQWKEAVAKEVTTLKKNGVVKEVPVEDLPSGTKPLRAHVVNVRKRDDKGNIVKYKSRLVTQGNRQSAARGDFDPSNLVSFTPDFRTILVFLTFAVSSGWAIENSDVDTAFHYSDLDEELYMWVPAGTEQFFSSRLVRIVKGLYGLKQAPRLWYNTLVSWLRSLGFVRSEYDACLFTLKRGAQTLWLVFWVDDFIFAASSGELMRWFKKQCSKRFSMKHLGPLKWCLGLKVDYTPGGCMKISQEAYIKRVAERFGVKPCGGKIYPPLAPGHVLDAPNTGTVDEKLDFRGGVGALMYLAKRTRPEISFATSTLARFFTRYTHGHYEVMKKVIRYLVSTADVGMTLDPCSKLDLTVYTDASYGIQMVDWRSVSGMCLFLGNNLIDWSSTAQRVTTLSTAEAEYLAMDVGTKAVLSTYNLIGSVSDVDVSDMVMCVDNQAAITIAEGDVISAKMRHVNTGYHFLRDYVRSGQLRMEYCPTDIMVADVFTKAMCYEKLVKFRKMLMKE